MTKRMTVLTGYRMEALKQKDRKKYDRINAMVSDGLREDAMTYAEKALARLEGYEGEEEFNDCIDGEGYDPAATRLDCASYRGVVAIYIDGSRLEYIEGAHCWEVAT